MAKNSKAGQTCSATLFVAQQLAVEDRGGSKVLSKERA